ncbi:hypothetical protein [Acetobacterium tundrae]|uniref:DUF4179 domain-containing protein n=1 Tax=Acetobacterium tundrae TaxID=132932 RepID=A0ABR6WL86_9FIRM|nr:hypothetical protein [Acetobacterium tundrae]MBC3797268.1 hypothetical protein [Acetobacterium tundrae]
MICNKDKKSNELPDIPPELAQKTLDNVFNACNVEPNKTPIPVLTAERKNIKRFHRSIVNLSIIAIIFLLLSPLAFIRPQFNLATESVSQNSIILNIEVSQFAKPISVNATINNETIPVTKISDTLYSVKVTDNGELNVMVTGLNYQITTKTAHISNLK